MDASEKRMAVVPKKTLGALITRLDDEGGPDIQPRSSENQEGNLDTKSLASQRGADPSTKSEFKPARTTEANAADEDVDEEGCDEEWMQNFACIRLFLIVFGRWPLTHRQDSNKRGYTFRFTWASVGFLFFLITLIFTAYGLTVSIYNVVAILMSEKIVGKVAICNRPKTQVIEQALLQRHTIMVTIMLGSYGVNFLTSCLIFTKREDIGVMFTKWTRILHQSKLSSGGYFESYYIAGAAFINYCVVSVIFFLITMKRTSATTIGGPTVISIMFARHFLPNDYLEKDSFVGSQTHKSMHVLGLVLYFYVVLTCNSLMYMFLWLVKSIDNAFFCWNLRTIGVVEAAYEDSKEDKPKPTIEQMTNERTTYQVLYHDHIGLVRMLSWFNNMFSFILEPYILLQLIKIVYQFYLAALVFSGNGKRPNKHYLGKYFMRKKDYIPVLLLMYENCFMVAAMLYAASWLDDTTYDSYEELRKKTLLKGTKTDKEAFFYLSMFQSYTSTTRMAVSAAQYFCIGRYTVLHVLSAIMSNFLVVFQFRPLFDMDTTDVEFECLRAIVGDFLTRFEGLPSDHYIPVSDAQRNQESS